MTVISKKHIVLLIFFGLLIAIVSSVATYLYLQRQQVPSSQPKPSEVFCTQDAKECPDGSYVGRTGPKCEFVPCPTPEN